MISLILSILSSTIILLIFKLLEKQKIDIFPPIVLNYVMASVLGFAISDKGPAVVLDGVPIWMFFSLIIGILLIGNFYLIGSSTQRAGIAVTTIAAKMSFVLPVLFSLMYDVNDVFNLSKGLQLFFAMVAVFLVVYPEKYTPRNLSSVLLPILIFFGLGILDTLIKYCQYHYIHNADQSSVFSAYNFTIAGIIGLTIFAFSQKVQKTLKNYKAWLFGIGLGAVNFGSMYFLINALNELKFDNSLVFGINNIGTIGMSVLMAFVVFKERFSKINWIGFVLAVIVLFTMLNIFM